MTCKIGTAAGGPLAGAIAAIALSKVTKKERARLDAIGLLSHIDTLVAKEDLDPGGLFSWPLHCVMGNYGIMDDDVYTATCQAAEAAGHAQTIAGVLFEEYSRAGLSLHLHAKKTCAVITFLVEGKNAAGPTCSIGGGTWWHTFQDVSEAACVACSGILQACG